MIPTSLPTLPVQSAPRIALSPRRSRWIFTLLPWLTLGLAFYLLPARSADHSLWWFWLLPLSQCLVAQHEAHRHADWHRINNARLVLAATGVVAACWCFHLTPARTIARPSPVTHDTRQGN